MKARRRFFPVVLVVVIAFIALAAAVIMLNKHDEAPIMSDAVPSVFTPQQIERGRYLALVGNCAGCHTTRGGAEYAGGLGIKTPFGLIYASNLTPDASTGIGNWSPDHFWRAMHNGRARDGRLLYPAFPYTSYTQITREDSDAIYAWLRTLPPVTQDNKTHALDFPYNTQAALAVWRALYFRPGSFTAQSQRPEEWNRGAYLVNGLGHCIACHGARNSLGATTHWDRLDGGMLPGEGWYAPALDSHAEAGLGDWPITEVVALLKTGVTSRASVSGPMAEVVYRSTQHLSESDLHAMAAYLQALPAHSAPQKSSAPIQRSAALVQRGEKIYALQCASCHGESGEGKAGMYPPLAANRAVNLANPSNLMQMVRFGGYAPTTEGNPRPYGMPPFGHVLTDEDIAAVLTYVRGSWGNNSPEVSLFQVMRR